MQASRKPSSGPVPWNSSVVGGRWCSTWAALGLFGLGCLVTTGAPPGRIAAVAAAQTGPPGIEALNTEARLLHRRLDLSGVMRWDRRERRWQPLGKPTERLLVINLWAASCRPCVEEFPLLRRMAAAWRSERDVRFLFVSDPPHDTEAGEVVAFWQQHERAVPDADPCRSSTDKLRAGLDNQAQPLTLLVDREGVVRQAFVGSIFERGLASAMERLLKVLRHSHENAGAPLAPPSG